MAEGLEALVRCGGHHELGFASIDAYALERCERSARWVQGSRALARQLAKLPAVRQALVSGEIGFCMAQIIARMACPADEERWLSEARRRTVREMRALAKERTESSQMFAEEEERVALTVTVDREAGWLFEATRMLAKQAERGPPEETLDAVLAEGTTSLLAWMDRTSIVPFDEALDERAAQRSWEGELARFREEAEVRCEAAIRKRMPVSVGDAVVPKLTWEGNAERIDAQLRSVSAELARRDLEIGDLAEAFWTADGWRRLGYATESQYTRERLGMSLSAVKAKRALARRAKTLPQLREAVNARALGYEAARLVAAVASPETADAWMERARERTVKHLREEVDVTEMLGRIGVDPKMSPPSEATMEKLAALERRIVNGPALQSDERRVFAGIDKTDEPALLQPDERRMFAGLDATDEPTVEDAGRPTPSTGKGDLRAHGRVTLRFRMSAGTRRYYRWLERMYLRHGPRAGSFFRYLCLSFIGVWQQRPATDVAYASIYARDLYRCTSPVCSRRDLTPHHLTFRSAGGDDSEENVASLCVWCHLRGVHGGALGVEPPASGMRWRIGRRAHTVVHGRRRTREPFGDPRGTVPG
jgi:hypothetical protein